jgi:hypothetical protein
VGRISRVAQTEQLTGRQVENLYWGWNLHVQTEYPNLHPNDPWFPFRDEAHRKECWSRNKEYLLSLRGKGRIPGVFGPGFAKNEIPQAMKDYEGKGKRKK